MNIIKRRILISVISAALTGAFLFYHIDGCAKENSRKKLAVAYEMHVEHVHYLQRLAKKLVTSFCKDGRYPFSAELARQMLAQEERELGGIW